MSSRSSRSGGGMGVGRGRTRGTLRRKEDNRSRERSSARSLATPAICTTESEKPNSDSMKKRQRSKCISSGFLLVRVAITPTTASLSQWARTRPRQVLPQTAAATTTANSSLKAIPLSQSRGHGHCHHWSSHQAPQPQEPEASDAN